MKFLKEIDKYLVLTLLFLYPLFFLPIFPNIFETSKLLILVTLVLIISTIKLVKSLISGGIKLKVSKFDAIVLVFSLVYLLSGIFMTPSKVDAFFFPGTASFVILGSVLYFFITQFTPSDRKQTNIVLSLSAAVLGIVEILSFTGVIKGDFTNFGNLINTFSFLLAILAISVFQVFKEKNTHFKTYFSIISFIIFISSFTSLYALLPGKSTSPLLPSLKTSWSVAFDSLKQSPLLGVGPSNFLYSFNKFRPITSNSDATWGSKFVVANNFVFTLISEVGVTGFLLFIALFVFSLYKYKEINQYKVSILVILILSLIYPYSPAFLPILFIFFGLNSESNEVTGFFSSKVPMALIFIPFFAMILGVGFLSYKAFYSEYMFGNTLKLVAKNDALKAYDSINKTVLSNPYTDRYHQVSSKINIAIAQSLSKKDKISDQDRKTLADLIQQSIRESKATVAINSSKSSSWEGLGDVYVSISSFVKDASKYSVQSYNQAIFLDPINPNLRIKLGGVYYADGNFEEAAKAFELAVLAKPDLANSHFNLAMAYKGNKQLDKAKEQMNIVLKLVDPNSNDYQLAKRELDAMNSKTSGKESENSPVQSDNLSAPQESPSPAIDPQLELQKDAQPSI